MKDQKYRHQVKFQFPCLVPEEEHCPVCTEGTDGGSQQQQVLRGPPGIAFCFPLIICKEKKRNNVENCVEGQKKNRDGKSSHPCRFVRGSYCFFVVNRVFLQPEFRDLSRKGIDPKNSCQNSCSLEILLLHITFIHSEDFSRVTSRIRIHELHA